MEERLIIEGERRHNTYPLITDITYIQGIQIKRIQEDAMVGRSIHEQSIADCEGL